MLAEILTSDSTDVPRQPKTKRLQADNRLDSVTWLEQSDLLDVEPPTLESRLTPIRLMHASFKEALV